MAASMTTTQAASGKFKGWHALVWFLGFFGFMFIVNGIFLWAAITSFPGEDVEKSYLTGLDYNQEIARRTLQDEAGWTAEIGLLGAGDGIELHVRLLDRHGEALPVYATTAQLRHPTDRAMDRMVDLSAAGGGEYTAPLTGLAPGIWGVLITADVDAGIEGHEFRVTREVRVP